MGCANPASIETLPHTLYNRTTMTPADRAYADIQSLKIQGATNVALAVIDALKQTTMASPDMSVRELQAIGTRLAYARPTEPLAQNCVRYVFANAADPQAIRAKLASTTALITDAKAAITKTGESVIHDRSTYLTHCHASSVTGIFLAAHLAGKHIGVIATETRPMYQGRRTAQELLDGGLTDVTMIVDSAAASILADPARHVAGILVGSDLLTETGFVNKIGTFAIALAARQYNIPLFCVSTLLKYDPRPFDPSVIEKRDPKEIWADAPTGLTIEAPAFDYTPYFDGVTIITEAGMIKGSEIKETAITNYPFIHL